MKQSRSICRSSGVVLASLLVGITLAQTPDTSLPTLPIQLPLKAEIVLSPEFCATKRRQSLGIKDVLKVGKAACEELYSALVPMFSNLERVEKVPAAGRSTAKITLIPRFIDISATQQPYLPSSQRKLVILLEWTIKDSIGRTIWLQTVQGSSEHKAGWMVTGKQVSGLVDAAVSDLATDSVTRISAAREIQGISR